MHYHRWHRYGNPFVVKEGGQGRPPRFTVGDRVGRLVVLGEAGRQDNRRLWRCRCDCGNEVVVGDLTLGRGTRSCGCLRRDNTTAQNRARATHGHTVGRKPTPTFNSWASMRDRCRLKTQGAYANYGGRGIKVCDRWVDSFENFLADMGERPPGTSLDRIDPYGNYEPGNCQWSTPTVQARNRRKTEELVASNGRYERALVAISRGEITDPEGFAKAILREQGIT